MVDLQGDAADGVEMPLPHPYPRQPRVSGAAGDLSNVNHENVDDNREPQGAHKGLEQSLAPEDVAHRHYQPKRRPLDGDGETKQDGRPDDLAPPLGTQSREQGCQNEEYKDAIEKTSSRVNHQYRLAGEESGQQQRAYPLFRIAPTENHPQTQQSATKQSRHQPPSEGRIPQKSDASSQDELAERRMKVEKRRALD